MFGYHKAKREKKRAKKEREQLGRERSQLEGQKPQLELQNEAAQKAQIDQKTQESKVARQEARKEGRQYAEDVIGRDVQGLTPAQRNAMQFEANKQIQRQHQAANRKLLGEQGRHGIVGKGGVGYAQQRDLQRSADESQGQVTRDLDKLNSDLALKKLAAMFNIEQGEVGQNQLDRQMAADELKLADEQKRQRRYEDQFNRSFSRV